LGSKGYGSAAYVQHSAVWEIFRFYNCRPPKEEMYSSKPNYQKGLADRLITPDVTKRFGFANAQFQYNKRGRKLNNDLHHNPLFSTTPD